MTPTTTWKRILILLICLWGVVFALPNAFYSRVEHRNDAVAEIEKAGGVATPEQEAARAEWPAWMPNGLMPLGLDLRGGAHLLARVEVSDVYKARIDAYWPDVRDILREQRDQVGAVRRAPAPDGVLRVTVSNPDGIPAAVTALQRLVQPITTMTGTGGNDIAITRAGNDIVIQLSDAEKAATDDRAVQQSLEIVRNRVDEVGTREPTILRQGQDRILIQVPGIGSAAELKALIGTTAKLTFNAVVNITNDAGANPGPRNILVPDRDQPGVYYILEETPVVSGDQLTDARPGTDEFNRAVVNFVFDNIGAKRFGDYTAQNIGRPFAIVLDNQVISAPTINSHIPGGRGMISGNFTAQTASDLAVLLRAGALPARMEFLEERTIGPELGADSIEAGRKAAIIGMIAVVLYMVLSYGMFGWFANVALVLNVILLVAMLSSIGATLTLPGIAGIVLTMGMAIDANVLIFERIREELRAGVSPAKACEAGFDRAFSAIMDANITALLTGFIMFWIGSGPVRGFAVTYTLGIITSMFTAVYVTRLVIELYINWKRPKTIVV